MSIESEFCHFVDTSALMVGTIVDNKDGSYSLYGVEVGVNNPITQPQKLMDFNPKTGGENVTLPRIALEQAARSGEMVVYMQRATDSQNKDSMDQLIVPLKESNLLIEGRATWLSISGRG